MKKMILFLILVLLVLGSCKTQETNSEPKTEPQAPIKLSHQTCEEQKGSICSPAEKCEGKKLDALDSFSCCSTPCIQAIAPPFENIKFGDDNASLGIVG